jgi:hypothetical protein
LAAAAARQGAVARGATGAADSSWSPSIEISSSLPFVCAAAFFGGCFVLPDGLRAVVLGAALDPAAFFSKKSVIEGWAVAVGFVFLEGLIYVSLSSSLSTLVYVWEGKNNDTIVKIEKARR